MSTRCQILVKDLFERHGISLYKHSDGYPDGEHGVLATLVPYVSGFLKNRGWDPEYLLARITGEFIRKSHEDLQRLERETGQQFIPYRFVGYGIKADGFHSDLSYVYLVTPDGVEVYRPGRHFWHEPCLTNCDRLKTVPYFEELPVRVPAEVFTGINAVKQAGTTNMFDTRVVAAQAVALGYVDTARWVEENELSYANGVLYGFEPDAP